MLGDQAQPEGARPSVNTFESLMSAASKPEDPMQPRSAVDGSNDAAPPSEPHIGDGESLLTHVAFACLML